MKRRNLTLGSLLLVAALAAVWWFGYHGVYPRLIFWPPPAEVPPPAALDETAEIDVADVPLAQVLAMLDARHGVPIELDPEMLQGGLITGDEPVTLKLSNVSLRSLLAHLAHELDFVVRTRRGEVYLTDPQVWAADLSNYVPRVYTLERLLAGPRPFNELELCELIVSVVAPERWDHSGGSGHCSTFPGGLVVSQTPDVQAQIANLLERLSELQRAPNSKQPVWLDPPNARTEALFAALRSPAKLECRSTTLTDVVAQLSREHQVPILLDMRALDGVGVSGKAPVACNLREIELGSVLYHVLWKLDLTYVIQNEAIVITTPEMADRQLSTRLYPVGDLLDEGRGIDAETVCNIISSHIAPTTWFDAGGPGELKPFSGCLVVSHSYKVHEQLEELLIEFRRALRYTPAGDLPERLTPAEARLEKALAARVSLKYDQIPLSEIAARLSEEHEIIVQFDAKELHGSGVDTHEPVTFQAENVPLETALRWMLAPLDLCPTVIAETLSITTPEVVDNDLETRCYRVRRLVEEYPAPNGRHSSNDFDALIDAIEALIASSSWEGAGGAGVIDALGDVLVVSQTREIHETLADFLRQLEMSTRRTPRGPTWAWVGERAEPCYARIDEALARRVNLEFKKMALGEVLAQVSAAHKIPIVFDRDAMTPIEKTEGIFDRLDLQNQVDPFGSDSVPFGAQARAKERRADAIPVNCNLSNVTLRLGLELLLREHGLGYAVRHGRVEITTLDEAYADMRLRLYDVRDLAARFSSNRHPVDLEELLKELIAQTTWDDYGGHGAMCQLGNTLGVTQSPEVHRRIEGFLDKLRRQPLIPLELTPIAVGDGPEAEQEVALTRSANFCFADQPLGEVLAELAREHRLPLVIERSALEKLGVNLDQRISYQREGGGVDLALDEILFQARPDNPLLGWRWRDGVLLVSDSDLLDRIAWIRLFPIPDLLRTETQGSAKEVRLPYYLEQLRGARQVLASGPFDSLPDGGFTFERALDRCLPYKDRDFDGTLNWTFYGNYLILGSDSREILSEMERFLAQVRELRSNPRPASPAGLASSDEVPARAITAYDLRPLLKDFPALSEPLLEDWLHDQMRPDRWTEKPNVFFPNHDAPPLGVWSGLLFADSTAEDDQAIRGALEFLGRLPADLPRPEGIARQDAQALARLVALIDTETGPMRLDYVLWLAGRLAKPSERLIEALLRRLERTDPALEANLCSRLYRSLGIHGPHAAAAVPQIGTHIQRKIPAAYARLQVETLAALGPRGIAEVTRRAVSRPSEPWVVQSLYRSMHDSPWKQTAVETLVPMLLDSDFDREAVLLVLNAVDPMAIGARDLLDQWRAKDPDPERRRFAVAAEEILKAKFGERQPKQ